MFLLERPGRVGFQGREFSLGTNQFTLGESVCHACTHAQLGEEQESEDEDLHGENVFVGSMMAGRSCVCRVKSQEGLYDFEVQYVVGEVAAEVVPRKASESRTWSSQPVLTLCPVIVPLFD